MYVVTTQWKFAKSGVGGHQLATTQHGDLSNPDLLPVTAHTWQGNGVDYSTPFVHRDAIQERLSDQREMVRGLRG